MTAFSWDSQPLGTVADLCLGKMLDQNKNRGDHLPYLANVNVRWGEFGLENLRTMRFERKEADRYGLKSGDIVMCEGGEPGRCAIWKNQVPGMMIQKALHRIRPKSLLDSSFLFYQFLHMGSLGKFDQFFTGATIKHLSGDKLAKVQVVVPPLPIQHRIASILSAYDDLIENNRKRIAILEEMARRLYREWFFHFRYPGHESVTFLDSPLGRIPQGWEPRRFGDVITLNYGKALKAEERMAGTIPVYGSSGVVGYHSESLVPGPGLIVGRKGNVGSLHWSDGPFYPIDTVFYATSTIFPLRFLLYSMAGMNFLNNDAAVPGLSRQQAYGLDVLVPDLGLLGQFCELAEPWGQLASNLARQSDVLRRTRDLLLPRLMSGQLSVEAAEAAIP